MLNVQAHERTVSVHLIIGVGRRNEGHKAGQIHNLCFLAFCVRVRQQIMFAIVESECKMKSPPSNLLSINLANFARVFASHKFLSAACRDTLRAETSTEFYETSSPMEAAQPTSRISQHLVGGERQSVRWSRAGSSRNNNDSSSTCTACILLTDRAECGVERQGDRRPGS